VIVLDASIAVAWFLPEEHASFAAGLIAGRVHLIAPDIIVAEVGNGLVKAFRRGVIKQPKVLAAVQHMMKGVIDLQPSGPLLPNAADLACGLRCSIYDATYIELARRRSAVIVTNDARLAEIGRSIHVSAHRPADGPLST
jgi:predicted nucleic acid-binding protein